MDETSATPEVSSSEIDPVKFTQEKLSEIGQVWLDFAKGRVETYKEKLPAAVKKFIEPKDSMASGGASAESGAA